MPMVTHGFPGFLSIAGDRRASADNSINPVLVNLEFPLSPGASIQLCVSLAFPLSTFIVL